MSWEQPCLDEASSFASSSKNAKDKSDSTTMEELHDSKDTDNSNERSCSEKDSGFSDTSSDCKHTDTNDQCNKKQPRETKEELLLNHNEPLTNSNRRNVIVAPAAQQLPSFYIIKNTVQPHIVQKNAQVLWSSGARPTSSGANPIILLQPPTPQLPTVPGLCKSNITAKKINAAYLPGNPYPRIAPHPSKKPPGKTTANGDTFSQSKRVCIEGNNTQTTRDPQEQHKPKVAPSTSLPSCSSATVSETLPTASVSSVTTTELNKNSIINTRHRRFVNTVQVLKQSGLWDITLRAKELMRQSNATRRDIAQLRQHSDLLCQVTSSSYQNPSNQKAAWDNLHKMMAESGSYPGLKDIQALQVPAAQEDVSLAKPPSVRQETGDRDKCPVGSDAGLAELVPQQSTKSTQDKSETLEEDKEATPDSSSDD